jgi:hypothetical protein
MRTEKDGVALHAWFLAQNRVDGGHSAQKRGGGPDLWSRKLGLCEHGAWL